MSSKSSTNEKSIGDKKKKKMQTSAATVVTTKSSVDTPSPLSGYKYNLYTFSDDFFLNSATHENITHPLCEFIKRAMPLLNVTFAEIVFIDQSKMMHSSLINVDMPCVLAFNKSVDSPTQIFSRGTLKTWLDLVSKNDFENADKYETCARSLYEQKNKYYRLIICASTKSSNLIKS
jgi:hypothetical protein